MESESREGQIWELLHELIDNCAATLGVSPRLLTIGLAAFAAFLIAGLWALSTFCWRCKCWFALKVAGTTGSTFTHDGKLYAETIVRCSVCGMESRGQKRLHPYL